MSDPMQYLPRECLTIPQGIARVTGNGFDRKSIALAMSQTLVTKQGDVRFVLGMFTDMLRKNLGLSKDFRSSPPRELLAGKEHCEWGSSIVGRFPPASAAQHAPALNPGCGLSRSRDGS